MRYLTYLSLHGEGKLSGDGWVASYSMKSLKCTALSEYPDKKKRPSGSLAPFVSVNLDEA